MPFFLVANLPAQLFLERFEQVECDVGGLKALGVGVGDVVDQGAEGAGARGRRGLFAAGERCGVEAGEQAGGDGLGVALDAGELAGEEDGVIHGGASFLTG